MTAAFATSEGHRVTLSPAAVLAQRWTRLQRGQRADSAIRCAGEVSMKTRDHFIGGRCAPRPVLAATALSLVRLTAGMPANESVEINTEHVRPIS